MLKLPQTLDAPNGAVFVSPTGATTGNGATASSPVSIARAQELVQQRSTATTVVLAGGTYRNFEWQSYKPNTIIQAAKGELPILDGTIEVAGPFSQSGATYVADYDNNLGSLYDPAPGKHVPDKRTTLPNKEYAANFQQIFIGDKFLDQVGSLTEVKAGKFFVDFAAKKLYLGDNPSGQRVRASKTKDAVRLGGVNSRIVGVEVFGYASSGITISGENGKIEHCRVLYTGIQGVQMAGKNTQLLDSEVGYSGLQCLGGGWFNQTLTVSRNNIHHGNTRQFNPAWSATILKMLGGNPDVKPTDKLVFEDNYIHDANVAGIWMDVNVHNASVKRNLVEDVTLGIFWEISQKAVIEDNIVRNCVNGIQVSCATDASIKYNTFENCNVPINVLDWGRDRSRTEKEHPAGDGWNTRRNIIENNLLVGAKGSYLRVETYQKELSKDYVASFKDNALVTTTAPASLIVWSNETAQEKQYNDLVIFRNENPGYGQNVVLYSKIEDVPQTVGVRAGVVVGGGYVSDGSEAEPTSTSTVAELETELFEVRTENEYLKQTNDGLVKENTDLLAQVANLNNLVTGLQKQVTETTKERDDYRQDARTDLEAIRDLAISKLSFY